MAENKFTRQAQQRDKQQKEKKTVVRDAQPAVDDQLGRLEEDMRRLKVEFDIFFNGACRRPPYDTKGRVETTIKRLADERSLSFAQRYRYNSLVARYTSFRELWRRTTQDREEGRGPAGVARSTPQREAETRSTFVCADAHRDVDLIRNLFDALTEAKKRCDEPSDDLSFPRFHRTVALKTDELKKQLGCERVKFSIGIENGRVSFKAKADE